MIRLPALLAEQAGAARFETDADTLLAALRALPIADLILDERGDLRPLVNVYVDGVDSRSEGLGSALPAGADVRVVAAIAGG